MLNDLLGRMTRINVLPKRQDYYPDFMEQRPWYRLTDGWVAYFVGDPQRKPARDPQEVFNLHVKSNGSGRLFCYRAAEREDGQLLLFEVLIADVTARYLSMFGDLYARAGYLGPADVGIAITGIKGAVTGRRTNRVMRSYLRPLDDSEYKRMERVLAASLVHDYSGVTQKLIMPLIDAVNQGAYNPFTQTEN